MGPVALPANPAATPSISAIGDAIYVAAPSTPATIAGTNIIYQEPQSGRAAPVSELTSVQQVRQFSRYSHYKTSISQFQNFLGYLGHSLSRGQFYLPLSHVYVICALLLTQRFASG